MKMGFVVLGVALTAIMGCQRGVVQTTPQPLVNTDMSNMRFNYKPDEIHSICRGEMDRLKSELDSIASRANASRSFENTVLAMESSIRNFNNNTSTAIFTKYVSTDADVRAAADACETDVQKFLVDVFVREDLYKAIKSGAESRQPTGAEVVLVDEFLTRFRQNGLELDAEKRAVFVEKKKRLVALEAEFSKNLVEWKDELHITEEETEGLPENFKKSLKKTSDGKYIVGLSYPHYYPFMDNARNASVRKKLEFKFNNRGGDKNRALLEQAIALRSELAKMLGYSTHAAFVLERKMAKNETSVTDFLSRLTGKLHPKGVEELKELLALKKKDDASATSIDAWDFRFYDNELRKKKFDVDLQKIAEYFPLDVVVNGMFSIYQTILNVKFVRDTKGPSWHEAVQLYQVKDGDQTVAYFYMDLFPREGKYGHAAAFTLLSGYTQEDGKYFAPVSSIVANFTPPAEGRPSLLQHNEVETLFHEFGHIMHQILTRARFGVLSGTSVKGDFVEAPSQMLENWCWDKEMLKKMSGHYQDNSKPLPDELINKLIGAKLANAGLKYLRQASFATVDMLYHTNANVDSTALYAKVMNDVMMIPIQDGTMPQAGFGHLMGGYDSGYYGYLWSEVYAQDMFTRFEKEGLLNKTAGMDYRKWILEPGGEREPFELIKGFIGREPNEEAFLRSIGLSTTKVRGVAGSKKK